MIKWRRKAPVQSEDYPLPNGMVVRVMPQTYLSWKVSVESNGPLEVYGNLFSKEEADFIAKRLCDKYRGRAAESRS